MKISSVAVVVGFILVAGCGGNVVSSSAPDFCDPPRAALASPVGECVAQQDQSGARVACPQPDGTEWTRYEATGWFARYRPAGAPGTAGEHTPAKLLCDVAPNGFIISRWEE